MKLTNNDNKILYTRMEEFDFDSPPIDPHELVRSMKEVMIAAKGIGLSANQINLPYRVFIMGNINDPESIISVFNPKIIDVSNEKDYYEEGCLSWPGLFIKIKRPLVVKVRYSTADNVTDTIKFDGITARVFQHEYDHMEGINYQHRASSFHLEQARRGKKRLDKLRKERLKQLSNS
jgi:peptide deformylase